mmetsp:Transcript_19905/g.31862  ORF Transcript_19905/g.31862 Transcript_19905/m.31862 type:complete len:215 (+) Transcript_19905:494-1138(+)
MANHLFSKIDEFLTLCHALKDSLLSNFAGSCIDSRVIWIFVALGPNYFSHHIGMHSDALHPAIFVLEQQRVSYFSRGNRRIIVLIYPGIVAGTVLLLLLLVRVRVCRACSANVLARNWNGGKHSFCLGHRGGWREGGVARGRGGGVACVWALFSVFRVFFSVCRALLSVAGKCGWYEGSIAAAGGRGRAVAGECGRLEGGEGVPRGRFGGVAGK